MEILESTGSPDVDFSSIQHDASGEKDVSLEDFLKAEEIDLDVLTEDPGISNGVADEEWQKALIREALIIGLKAKPFPFSLLLYDDDFTMDYEEDIFYLQHSGSSLLGYGKTMVEAHISLIERARDVADLYLGVPSDELHETALRLRDLLLRII